MALPKDFYALLGVGKADARDADKLKKAYKKMAMKTHPDRKGGNQEEFKRVAEAYDVLSDANKRAIYDQYGEEGLKQGFQPPTHDGPGTAGGGFGAHGGGFGHGGAFGGAFGGQPTTSGGFASREFSNEDAARMFESFFGGGAFGRGGGVFGEMGGAGGGRGGFGSAFAGDDMDWGGGQAQKKRRGENVVNLECTLEELYRGTQKQFAIKRRVNAPSGQGLIERDEKIVVDVKRGWKDGTKITFERKGNEEPGVADSAADLVVVVKEASHRWFKREKDDLVFSIPSITIRSALVGFKVKIPGIDGEEIEVSFEDSCTEAGAVRVVPNKGMPNQRTGARGDLIVKVQKVTFPKSLTEKQKTLIKQAFSTSG